MARRKKRKSHISMKLRYECLMIFINLAKNKRLKPIKVW